MRPGRCITHTEKGECNVDYSTYPPRHTGRGSIHNSAGITSPNRIGAGCRRSWDTVTTDLTVINGDKIGRPKTPKAETPTGAFQSAFMHTSPRCAT